MSSGFNIDKLGKILYENGIIIVKYFSKESVIFFLECLIINTVQKFYIRVLEKYNIRVNRKNDTYNLKELNIEELNDIYLEFSDIPDEIDLDKLYMKYSSELSNKLSSASVNSNYNTITNNNRSDLKSIRSSSRQHKRLSHIVNSTKYRLCLVLNMYLFVGDKIYMVNKKISAGKQLFIVLDLKYIFEDLHILSGNISSIENEVEKSIDLTINRNILSITNLLSRSNDLISGLSNFKNYKENYESNIFEYNKTLDRVIKSEGFLTNDIMVKKQEHLSRRNFSDDISYIHIISKLKSKLKEIRILKQQTLELIIKMKSDFEDKRLMYDQVCFDNLVLINTIKSNFSLLA